MDLRKELETKLTAQSNKYSDTVRKIRALKEDLKKAKTDADTKKINDELAALNKTANDFMKEYNRLVKLRKDAKSYDSLSKSIKEKEAALAKATARGEDVETLSAALTKARNDRSDLVPNLGNLVSATKADAAKGADKLESYTVNINGKPTKFKWDTVKGVLLKEDGSPYTGTVPWADQTVTYKNGKKVSTTAVSKDETKPTTGGTTGGATTGGRTGGATGGTTGGRTGAATGGATGKEVPSGFNVGTFRKADEASMAEADGKTPPGPKTPLDTLLAKTEFWYDLPDYIFKIDSKLGDLLVKAVAEDWDPGKFLASAKLTPWWQKNADSVRTKIVNREKYNDLLKSGEDVKNTEYGMYLGKHMRSINAQAKDLADVTLTDAQAQSIAQKIYDGNLEDDPLAINALIVPFIGRTTSIVGTGTKQTGFGGQALQNYQTLQGIAKANGFSLKDILPNISAVTAGGDLETAVLRGLANGDIDINRVAQDARALAATGQPKYVRDLLGQGYDLEAVYAPYRKTMATELELDPNTIDLNDSTLRMAISDKGDMNLYDFKKALRQDSRWQYTGTAKEEVSNAALKVLRDFGFQG
jgi:hypothetical protein